MDRNGLRPSRYSITSDGIVVVASESGVVDLPAATVIEKGVLGPAEMFIVDTTTGNIMKNEEIKTYYAKQHPYKEWLEQQLISVDQLEKEEEESLYSEDELLAMWKLFGYTDEVFAPCCCQWQKKAKNQLYPWL